MLQNIPLRSTECNDLFAPEAIAVDLSDNILLVDSFRSCLLIFARDDSHLIAECARDNLRNRIAVDRMGQVIISDSSNKIKVF